MATCKKCGKEILWIQTQQGKWMPCDPDLKFIRKGTSHKFVTVRGEVVSGEFARGVNDADGTGYTPHWSSCPYAEEFRRRER